MVVHGEPGIHIAPGEVGAVCALRDGIPLVLAGDHTHSPFARQCDAVATGVEDVPAACERAVEAAAARAAEYVGAFAGTDATVTRRGHAVSVHLGAGATPREIVLAHQAAARHFPSARSIDVSAARS